MKAITECYSVDDFIQYYTGASKSELTSRLKELKKKSQMLNRVRCERKAIETLLA